MMPNHAKAFPSPREWQEKPGLTKREWMATTILAGLCAGGALTSELRIEEAIEAADKLLEKLK